MPWGKILKLVLAAVCVTAFWGCAGNLPDSPRIEVLEEKFGESFRSARDKQILNPEAGKNDEPVVGLDGQAAQDVKKTYNDWFKKVEQPKVVKE